MYTELILFRNELKNKSVPKYKIIGIVSELILSKTIFHTNLDIERFLMEVFSLEFKKYLFKSRTLIAAKLIKEIMLLENYSAYKNKLYIFIQQKIYNLEDDKSKKKINLVDGFNYVYYNKA